MSNVVNSRSRSTLINERLFTAFNVIFSVPVIFEFMIMQ